jgi:transcriptional regulator GlxA family with amidase domain
LNGTIPRKYGIILFRAFDTIDVTGPLEVLQLLGSMHTTHISFIAETLDPVSTEPVTAAMNPKNSTVWTTLTPTHTFANAPDDLDVLIIPGGAGSRSPKLDTVFKYIEQTAPKVKQVLTICTGSGVAAKAGILNGRKATTNKTSWKEITAYGPNTTWVPKARWVEDNSGEVPIWSSSGVTAGFDMMLQFVEKVYGIANATRISNVIEHVRITDPSNDPFAVNANATLSAN